MAFSYNSSFVPAEICTHAHVHTASHSSTAEHDPEYNIIFCICSDSWKNAQGRQCRPDIWMPFCPSVWTAQPRSDLPQLPGVSEYKKVKRKKNHQTIIDEKSPENGKMLINMSNIHNPFTYLCQFKIFGWGIGTINALRKGVYVALKEGAVSFS